MTRKMYIEAYFKCTVTNSLQRFSVYVISIRNGCVYFKKDVRFKY